MTLSKQIRRKIEDDISGFAPGEFLPPDRLLCAEYGVSPRLVAQVMKQLSKDGLVERIPGKGTRVPDIRTKHALQSHRSSEEMVAETIRGYILSGELKAGDPLPLRKQMCLQFKVAPATVTRAYDLLSNQSMVTRMGKRYWVGDFKQLIGPQRSNTIYMIECSHEGVGGIVKGAHFGKAYTAIEQILVSYGFRICYEPVASLKKLHRQWTRTAKLPHAVIMANTARFIEPYYSNASSYLTKTWQKSKPQLRPRIVNIGVPFAVKSRSIIQAVSGSIPTVIGRKIARFIIAKGYRRAALFFDEHGRNQRYFFDFIHAFVELINLNRNFSVDIYFRTSERKLSKDKLLVRLNEATYTDNLKFLKENVLGKYGQLTLDDLMRCTTIIHSWNDAFSGPQKPAAWVFSHDFIAAHAADWCASNRLNIPRDIGLIGMQNDPGHFAHGITSCIFDMNGFAYAAAHAAIGDISLEKTTRGYMRLQALMLERQTTP